RDRARRRGGASLLRLSVLTTVWGAAGRAVGMLVPPALAAWYGVSRETDALFFAYGLVVTVANVFAAGLESAVVPFALEARARAGGAGFVGRLAVAVFL